MTSIVVEPAVIPSGTQAEITIRAQPNERIPLFLSFNTSLPVVGGEFYVTLENFVIPQTVRHISGRASPVLSMSLGTKVALIPVAVDAVVNNGVGEISTRNYQAFLPDGVPSGTYDISIWGRSNADTVSLVFTAEAEIVTGENGFFVLSYPLGRVTPGVLSASVGGTVKTVRITSGAGAVPRVTATYPRRASLQQSVTYSVTPIMGVEGVAREAIWSFDDGTTLKGLTVNHPFTTLGVHAVHVRVINDIGGETSMTLNVLVSSSYSPKHPSTGDYAVTLILASLLIASFFRTRKTRFLL